MKKLSLVLILALMLISVLIAAAGCSPGPGSVSSITPAPSDLTTPAPSVTSSKTPAPTFQPTITPAAVQPGTLLFYYWKMASSGSSTQNLPEVGLATTSLDVGGFYRYLLDGGSEILVEKTMEGTNLGYLWSKGESVNNGRVFISEEPLGKWVGTGTLTIHQADVSTGKLSLTTLLQNPVGFAVVGDSVYYLQQTVNSITGEPNGQKTFRKIALGKGSNIDPGAFLLASNDPDNYGSPKAVGDNLYRVDFNPKRTGKEVLINSIDDSTGHIIRSIGYPHDADTYADPKFFTDDHALYIVEATRNPVPSDTGELHYGIWIGGLTPADFEAGKGFTAVDSYDAGSGSSTPKIQVCTADEGYILIEYNYGSEPWKGFLFDSAKGTEAEMTLPGTGGQLFVAR